MSKILCFMGWHRWMLGYVYKMCERCGKTERIAAR